jgi:membrane protein implicated in regulation of membrane protease activity
MPPMLSDVVGTTLGRIGMLAFGFTFSLLVRQMALIALVAALVAWTVVSVVAWWTWRRGRKFERHRKIAASTQPASPHSPAAL